MDGTATLNLIVEVELVLGTEELMMVTTVVVGLSQHLSALTEPPDWLQSVPLFLNACTTLAVVEAFTE